MLSLNRPVRTYFNMKYAQSISRHDCHRAKNESLAKRIASNSYQFSIAYVALRLD